MAFFIMFLISALETSAFKKFIIPLFTVSFIFLALVPLIGIEVKGAKRWLDYTFLDFNLLNFLNLFLF